MSRQVLPGSGWENADANPNACGCFLLVLNVGGQKVYLSTKACILEETTGGEVLKFPGGIVNDLAWEESVDVYGGDASVLSFDFEVPDDFLDFKQIRKQGLVIQGVEADLYWYVTGLGIPLTEAYHVLNGYLSEPSYDEGQRLVKFRVEDPRFQGGSAFPPVVATSDRFARLRDTDSGKVYPVIVGECKKVAMLQLDTDDPYHYLAALDDIGEGLNVTAVYDGESDLPMETEFDQQHAADLLGTGYWRVYLDDPPSEDMYADITGHTPADLAESIRWLANFFTAEKTSLDKESLNRLGAAFPLVIMAAIYNSRSSNTGGGNQGLFETVIKRLSTQAPFLVIRRGLRYEFVPLVWDRNVVKHLAFEKNIIRKVSGPTETRRSDIYSQFTVKWGNNGYRGEQLGCITRDETNSRECLLAKSRYGDRAKSDITCQDVADAQGAGVIANWQVETFSRMRVQVSYECTFDTAGLEIFDTVRVFDKWEEWNLDTESPYRGGVLFKVVGIKRGTGRTIVYDLLSIDDYYEVYGINT